MFKLNLPASKYIGNGLSGLVQKGQMNMHNSILQCLSHTLQLTDYMLFNGYARNNATCSNQKFLYNYYTLLDKLWASNSYSFNELVTSEKSSHAIIKDRQWMGNGLINPCKFNRIIKELFTNTDSPLVFLLEFLELLHKSNKIAVSMDINTINPNEKVDELILKSMEYYKTSYQENYSVITDLFYGLQYDGTAFSPFNIIHVNSSGNLVDHVQKNLWNIPQVLIFKIPNGALVEFPENLDMTLFLSSHKNDSNNYLYNLYAINYESDTKHWSCCKNLNESWYIFTESQVSKIPTYNIHDATLLFYHRKTL